MKIKVYNDWSIEVRGHKFVIMEATNTPGGKGFAPYCISERHFLDYELKDYGFDEGWIRNLQPRGIVKEGAYLFYRDKEDAEYFVKKLIVFFVKNPDYCNIEEVCVQKGKGGDIIKSLMSEGIITYKDINNNYILKSKEEYDKMSMSLCSWPADMKLTNLSVDLAADDADSCLEITIKRKHKLNIDFKE